MYTYMHICLSHYHQIGGTRFICIQCLRVYPSLDSARWIWTFQIQKQWLVVEQNCDFLEKRSNDFSEITVIYGYHLSN